MEKVEFTRCAVAFLDVLGFKTVIEAAERDDSPEGLQFAALQNVITRQLDFVQTDGGGGAAFGLDRFPKDIDLRILHVSDSFVLSAPISSERHPAYSGMVAVAIKSIQLAHQLLKMGFLIRGGLAVGNVHRTESNIFGTGYQVAYATEKCAGTPRVLFHQSAVEYFDTACHLGLPLSSMAIFAREGNETMLDTLVAHWCYVGEDLGADVAEVFRFHKATIERRLSELPSGSARDKWEWMAKYFNAKQRNEIDLRAVGAVNIDKYSIIRFGPLVNHSATTFEETFGPFAASPAADASTGVEGLGSVTDGGE